jgi:hypothetical protein
MGIEEILNVFLSYEKDEWVHQALAKLLDQRAWLLGEL